MTEKTWKGMQAGNYILFPSGKVAKVLKRFLFCRGFILSFFDDNQQYNEKSNPFRWDDNEKCPVTKDGTPILLIDRSSKEMHIRDGVPVLNLRVLTKEEFEAHREKYAQDPGQVPRPSQIHLGRPGARGCSHQP